MSSSKSVMSSKNPKRSRSALMRVCRKAFDQLNEAIDSNSENVLSTLDVCNEKFRKFVDAHENYLKLESDETDLKIANDQYAVLRDELLKLKQRCDAKPNSAEHKEGSVTEASVESSVVNSTLHVRSRLIEAKLRRDALQRQSALDEKYELRIMELEKVKREFEREKKLQEAELEVEIAERLAKVRVSDTASSIEFDEPPIVGTNVAVSNYDADVRSGNSNSDSCKPVKSKIDQSVDCKPSVKNLSISPKSCNDLHALAEAFRHGSSLPNLEMAKFSGDPGEYASFMTSFKVNVVPHISSDSELYLRLLSLCEGKAREAIKSCINLPLGNMYESACTTLKENFGLPHMVADSQIKRLKEFHLKRVDSGSLMLFARRLEDSKRVLEGLGSEYAGRLDNEDLIKAMLRKFPVEGLKRKWVERAGDILETKPSVKFDDFVSFVRGQGRKLNNTFSDELKSFQTAPKGKVTSFEATSSSIRSLDRKFSCIYCEGDHRIWNCESFKTLPVPERYRLVMQKKLCWRCLRVKHRLNDCKSQLSCVTCKSKRHNSLLHRDKSDDKWSGRDQESNREVAVNATMSASASVWLKVVPVKVIAGNRSRIVNAFIDNGSDTTLCTKKLLNELGVSGENLEYQLTTIAGDMVVKGTKATLKVQSLFSGNKYDLLCISTDTIPITQCNFVRNDEISQFSHLKDIPLPKVYNSDVAILIGSDNIDIVESQLDKRVGKPNEPIGVLTCLGWTICGSTAKKRCSSLAVHRIHVRDNAIEENFQMLYNSEFQDLISSDKTSLSPDDQRADNLMKSSVELLNGHYSIALPFRYDAQRLMNNHPLAEKRLGYLKRKLNGNAHLKAGYFRVIERYVKEGAAKRIGQVDRTDRWYLPHHAVVSKKKPDPRVVFDCAAEYGGQSLNKALYKGPDNTSSLVQVLIRFRIDPIAVIADIRSMFHQVRVKPEDSKRLSFLWWSSTDTDTEPETYEMVAHLFGATSSPSICGFALRTCADDHSSSFPSHIVESVKRNFYVDDMLCSYPDVESAISSSKQVVELLSEGGFHLTKFLSNSRTVNMNFPPTDRAPSITKLNLELDHLASEKTLGVTWNLQDDYLIADICEREFRDNRRGVLSSVASVFDPLGLSAPFILRGKLINQELARRKLNWDEKLPDDILIAWRQWLSELKEVRDLGIPRCLKPLDIEFYRVELHHFSDASEEGYGTVSYLRFLSDSEIHCSFVYGRSRVKPTKAGMTIPKLELTAATLLISVDKLLKESLRGGLKVDETYFWTDSMIVLRYIYNESKSLTTFVSNRVAKIREASSPQQWRHVRSQDNPADIASRGLRPSCVDQWKMWSRGPNFLGEKRKLDRFEFIEPLKEEDEGVKPIRTVMLALQPTDQLWTTLFNRYSSWTRLNRIVAWILRAIAKFRNIGKPDNIHALTLSELESSEQVILKSVQRQSFISTTDSSLSKLQPVLRNDLICVGGRLERSKLPEDIKHPIIVPSKHKVTKLLIMFCHIHNGHVGTNHTLALLRNKYWIIHGASTVRRVIRKCQYCRRYNQRPGSQVMSPLPEARVSADESSYPFEVCGVDLFGPFHVSRGTKTRSQVTTSLKRYGVIFTCLKCRAVHLELAYDLSTDAFISALVRFISRRGPPRVMISDNGTNFKGACIEIIEGLKKLQHEKIGRVMSERNVEWRFNPPGASHWGGIWERLIRSVRRILNIQLRERVVFEDTLYTLLCEIEKILNDRPITKLSDDPKDFNCLTPNHILLVGRNPSSGFVSGNDLRVRYKSVMAMANEFWYRWRREYLTTLQERQRWHRIARDFQAGDLVLLVDSSAPRGVWKKGLIIDAIKGADARVREVTVKTADGELRRDIRKVCLLEQQLFERSSCGVESSSS